MFMQGIFCFLDKFGKYAESLLSDNIYFFSEIHYIEHCSSHKLVPSLSFLRRRS